MNNLSKLIVEAIKDQKEIFGDSLFENVELDIDQILSNNVVNEETSSYMPNNSLFENFSNCTTLESESLHPRMTKPIKKIISILTKNIYYFLSLI